MGLDPVDLTKEFVGIKSVSRWSNAEISDLVEERMKTCGFEVERLSFTDQNGELKVSLVGKKGEGKGGIGFFSHTEMHGDSIISMSCKPHVREGY